MPVTPTFPGIYIEEIKSNAHTINAAPTSVTVFVGYTHPFKTRPDHYGDAVEIFSFSDYEREFGGLYSVDWLSDDVGQAVNQFFLNGGAVAAVDSHLPTDPFTSYDQGDFAAAFATDGSLDKVAVFNLLLTPGIWDPPVVSEALAFAERKRAFSIVDAPGDTAADPTGFPLPLIGDVMTDAVPGRVIPKSQNGALYFPYLRGIDPESGDPISVAPSGFVAGIFAREDESAACGKRPPGWRRSSPTRPA